MVKKIITNIDLINMDFKKKMVMKCIIKNQKKA